MITGLSISLELGQNIDQVLLSRLEHVHLEVRSLLEVSSGAPERQVWFIKGLLIIKAEP